MSAVANLGAMPLGIASVALPGVAGASAAAPPEAAALDASNVTPAAAPARPAPAHVVATHAATLQHPQPHAPGTSSAAGAVGGTVFALLFVLGLILALAWLAKRMPGIAGNGNPALRVVASLPLGPRERVVVVDVGGQQLLLGVGAGGTRALHTLETPLPPLERAQRVAVPPFAQLLAQRFGKKA